MLNEKSGGLEGRLGLFREREQIVGETRAQVEQLMDQQEHLSHDALRLEEEVYGHNVCVFPTQRFSFKIS